MHWGKWKLESYQKNALCANCLLHFGYCSTGSLCFIQAIFYFFPNRNSLEITTPADMLNSPAIPASHVCLVWDRFTVKVFWNTTEAKLSRLLLLAFEILDKDNHYQLGFALNVGFCQLNLWKNSLQNPQSGWDFSTFHFLRLRCKWTIATSRLSFLSAFALIYASLHGQSR